MTHLPLLLCLVALGGCSLLVDAELDDQPSIPCSCSDQVPIHNSCPPCPGVPAPTPGGSGGSGGTGGPSAGMGGSGMQPPFPPGIDAGANDDDDDDAGTADDAGADDAG